MNPLRFLLVMAAAAAALASPSVALANPPVAWFTMSPEAPKAGEMVTFDASASTADHPSRRSYYWFIDQPFNSNNHLPATSNPVLNRSFTAGFHTVDLIVADDMCLEPPAGDNCYSSKARKSFTVPAPCKGADCLSPEDRKKLQDFFASFGRALDNALDRIEENLPPRPVTVQGNAPAAGVFKWKWSFRFGGGAGANAAAKKRVVLGKARTVASRAGKVKAKLVFRKAGVRALRKTRKAKVTLTTTFTDTARRRITKTTSHRYKRKQQK